jgi:hypothetical protein
MFSLRSYSPFLTGTLQAEDKIHHSESARVDRNERNHKAKPIVPPIGTSPMIVEEIIIDAFGLSM